MERVKFNVPEILRSNLELSAIKLLKMNYDIEQFEFIDAPDAD